MLKMSKHLHNISLILSALLLVFTATMLRGTIAKLSDYFTKQTVPARKPLKTFVDSVESIEKNFQWKDQAVTQEIETDDCFLIKFESQDQSVAKHGGYIHAAYYSQPGSKVPHTPDVCYRQAGSIIKEIQKIPINLSPVANNPETIDVTLVRLEQKEAEMVILFCFIAEGQIANSRTKVRLITSKPGNSRTYFCKVEASCSYPKGSAPKPYIETAGTLMERLVPKLLDEYLPTEEMLK